MMGKIMKRNDFGKIVNYTMKGNNKSKLLATEGVRSDSKQHIAESFSCQAGLNTRIRTPVYHISSTFFFPRLLLFTNSSTSSALENTGTD